LLVLGVKDKISCLISFGNIVNDIAVLVVSEIRAGKSVGQRINRRSLGINNSADVLIKADSIAVAVVVVGLYPVLIRIRCFFGFGSTI